jgi:hypothetical protein
MGNYTDYKRYSEVKRCTFSPRDRSESGEEVVDGWSKCKEMRANLCERCHESGGRTRDSRVHCQCRCERQRIMLTKSLRLCSLTPARKPL